MEQIMKDVDAFLEDPSTGVKNRRRPTVSTNNESGSVNKMLATDAELSKQDSDASGSPE